MPQHPRDYEHEMIELLAEPIETETPGRDQIHWVHKAACNECEWQSSWYTVQTNAAQRGMKHVRDAHGPKTHVRVAFIGTSLPVSYRNDVRFFGMCECGWRSVEKLTPFEALTETTNHKETFH